MNFAIRRRSHIAVTVVVAGLLLIAFAIYDASLYRGAFFTGWVLLTLMLFLASFNVRKKLSVLPLGAASTWAQLHIYGGWLAVLVFGEHIGWRIPDGGLEIAMTVLFVFVAGSGIFGIILARFLPPRLTRRGEEVIFERIPGFIAKLRDEAETLVVTSAKETRSSTVSDFYTGVLAPFFMGPQNRLRHLIASRQARFRLLNEIKNLRRYLNDQESVYADRLRDLVNKKDELDFHYSLNLALKAWLLVHVPATYGLVILAALHLVLAYAFGGGVG